MTNFIHATNMWLWHHLISSTIAEIFLQHYENDFIKHWIEDISIMYYSRYVDDIVIIFNVKHSTEDTILNNMNSIHKSTEFKMTPERLQLDIFHKSTATSTMIHAQSNHIAYRYYVQCLQKIPLSENKRKRETCIIKQIALDNGYTHEMINCLNNPTLRHKQDNTLETMHKKWTTFTYLNATVRKITDIQEHRTTHNILTD
jgi:hypothetical protein